MQGQGLSDEQVCAIARESKEKYGASIYAFARASGKPPEEVHRRYHEMLDVSYVTPDPTLSEAFKKIPADIDNVLLTEGNKETWTDRVLSRLGLDERFRGRIYDFVRIGFKLKSRSPAAFLQILRERGFRPDQAVAIDDRPENLKEAYEQGITTILVCGDRKINTDDCPWIHCVVKDLHEILNAFHRPAVSAALGMALQRRPACALTQMLP